MFYQPVHGSRQYMAAAAVASCDLAGLFKAVALPRDVAHAIRDTADGAHVPNLPWAVVESLTHMWQVPKIGSGGFGEVYKGM